MEKVQVNASITPNSVILPEYTVDNTTQYETVAPDLYDFLPEEWREEVALLPEIYCTNEQDQRQILKELENKLKEAKGEFRRLNKKDFILVIQSLLDGYMIASEEEIITLILKSIYVTKAINKITHGAKR